MMGGRRTDEGWTIKGRWTTNGRGVDDKGTMGGRRTDKGWTMKGRWDRMNGRGVDDEGKMVDDERTRDGR